MAPKPQRSISSPLVPNGGSSQKMASSRPASSSMISSTTAPSSDATPPPSVSSTSSGVTHHNGSLTKVDIMRTYGSVCLEYSLMNEYAIFRKKFIPGVYIMPSFESALKWFCVLFVRKGVYEGGAFRFELHMSSLFPDGEVPRVVFDPPVFHPLVHAISGEMDISSKFPRWRRDENHIFEVIEVVKSNFEHIEKTIARPSNKEAYKLYLNNPEEFKRVVEECVAQCMEHLQTEIPSKDDPNCFNFVAQDTHDLSLDESSLFSLRLDSSECSNDVSKSPQRLQGLSWMRNGKPFAKP